MAAKEGIQSSSLWTPLLFGYASFGVVIVSIALKPFLLPPSAHLLVLATLTVTVGCVHAVALELQADEYVEGGGDLSQESDESQSLNAEDAYWFPIMGSCMLFGLFLLLKYLPVDFVKKILIPAYIVMICSFGLATNFVHLSKIVYSKLFSKKEGDVFSWGLAKELFNLPFVGPISVLDIVGLIGAAGLVSVYWFGGKPFYLNNTMGVSFCLLALKLIRLDSFKTGTIMFAGLFLYDIFWVFLSKPLIGSNVMVTVAKGIEAPILLRFPRENIDKDGVSKMEFSMLGLGDIVVPGMFLAMLLRFDIERTREKGLVGFTSRYKYFIVSMVFYVGSLVTTVAVMIFFEAAQPALLYIVPYVLIACLGTALLSGEWKDLTGFVAPGEEPESPTEGEPVKDADAKKVD
jgi:minor histocompatibility antigen H13